MCKFMHRDNNLDLKSVCLICSLEADYTMVFISLNSGGCYLVECQYVSLGEVLVMKIWNFTFTCSSAGLYLNGYV